MQTNFKFSDRFWVYMGYISYIVMLSLTVIKPKFVNSYKSSVYYKACHFLFVLLLSQKGSKYVMKLPFTFVFVRCGKSETRLCI
jgi:hypothetical protein